MIMINVAEFFESNKSFYNALRIYDILKVII